MAMVPLEQLLTGAAVLLLAGVVASKISGKLGVPALLLFLLIGMLAGSEGPGGIPFDDARLAQSLGVLALALILFSGGLDTEWRTIASVAWCGVALSTVGVLLTAALVGAFASLVLGFSGVEGMLLGSIVSSTDAAAVFSILRSRNASLKGRLGALLEMESGSNDPMAVFLTLACVRLLTTPALSPADLVPIFFLQMGVGAAAGWVFGKLAIWALNRSRLESEGLYPVLTLALVLLSYSLTAQLKGNGFLAVYLAGLVMANGDFIHKRSLMRFHDGLAWLMQIVMFLVLGLLVFPSHVGRVAGLGLLVSFFLMLVARPASVFVSLALARLDVREKLLISWVGLRGAVPIILATFPLLAGLPKAALYFNVVFFIVITSVLLQGTTLPLVARRLRLDAPLPRRHQPLEFLPDGKTTSELVELTLPEGSPAVGRQIVDLHLPKSVLVVLISRDDDYIVPKGGTVVQAGDTLMVLAAKAEVPQLRRLLGAA